MSRLATSSRPSSTLDHDAPLLEIAGLTKRYGATTVLDGVSMSVRAGEVVSLLGANGSGKSTSLRCVVGLTEPDGGTITVDDRVAAPGRPIGGQQQRVAVARALCQRAKVLLADEPVSALDPAAAEQVMRLLRSLADEDGIAVAAVLHQPDLARRHSDRILGLLRGRIAFALPAAEVDDRTIEALYRPDAEAER